jgi:hypothetical protein
MDTHGTGTSLEFDSYVTYDPPPPIFGTYTFAWNVKLTWRTLPGTEVTVDAGAVRYTLKGYTSPLLGINWDPPTISEDGEVVVFGRIEHDNDYFYFNWECNDTEGLHWDDAWMTEGADIGHPDDYGQNHWYQIQDTATYQTFGMIEDQINYWYALGRKFYMGTFVERADLTDRELLEYDVAESFSFECADPTTIKSLFMKPSPITNIIYDGSEIKDRAAIAKLKLSDAVMTRQLENLDTRLDYIENSSSPTLLGVLGGACLTVASFAAPGVLLTSSMIAGCALTAADAALQGETLRSVAWSIGGALHGIYFLRKAGVIDYGIGYVRDTKDVIKAYARDVMPWNWRRKLVINPDTPFSDEITEKFTDQSKLTDDSIPWSDRDPDAYFTDYLFNPLTKPPDYAPSAEEIAGVATHEIRGNMQLRGHGFTEDLVVRELGLPKISYSLSQSILDNMEKPGLKGKVANLAFNNFSQPEHQFISITQPFNVRMPDDSIKAIRFEMNIGIGHGPQPDRNVEYWSQVGSSPISQVDDEGTRKSCGIEYIFSYDDKPVITESFKYSRDPPITVDQDDVVYLTVNNLRIARKVYDDELYNVGGPLNYGGLTREDTAAVFAYQRVYKARTECEQVRKQNDVLLTPGSLLVLCDWMERKGGLRDSWVYSRLNHNCNTFAKEFYNLVANNGVSTTSKLPRGFVDDFLRAQTTINDNEITVDDFIALMISMSKTNLQNPCGIPRRQ